MAPPDWREVSVGTIRFRFPADRKLSGHDDACGAANAPPNCVIFDEGPVLSYTSGGFRLRTRDDYGETGPPPVELGPAVTINSRKVHLARLADGTAVYTVTAASAGSDSAALLWMKPTDPLLWLSCRSANECRMAEAVAGSVTFETARKACNKLNHDRRLAAERAGRAFSQPGKKCRKWVTR